MLNTTEGQSSVLMIMIIKIILTIATMVIFKHLSLTKALSTFLKEHKGGLG